MRGEVLGDESEAGREGGREGRTGISVCNVGETRGRRSPLEAVLNWQRIKGLPCTHTECVNMPGCAPKVCCVPQSLDGPSHWETMVSAVRPSVPIRHAMH